MRITTKKEIQKPPDKQEQIHGIAMKSLLHIHQIFTVCEPDVILDYSVKPHVNLARKASVVFIRLSENGFKRKKRLKTKR